MAGLEFSIKKNRKGPPAPEMPSYMMMDTPEEMTMSIVIDQFSTSYRAWDQSRHVHFSSASYGSCAAHGKTLEQAVSNLGSLVEKSRPGFHCTPACPDYIHDIY